MNHNMFLPLCSTRPFILALSYEYVIVYKLIFVAETALNQQILNRYRVGFMVLTFGDTKYNLEFASKFFPFRYVVNMSIMTKLGHII